MWLSHRQLRRSAQVFLVGALGLVLTQTVTGQLPDDEFKKLFTSTSLQSGPIRWHYLSGGTGDVVVLLHGLAANVVRVARRHARSR